VGVFAPGGERCARATFGDATLLGAFLGHRLMRSSGVLPCAAIHGLSGAVGL